MDDDETSNSISTFKTKKTLFLFILLLVPLIFIGWQRQSFIEPEDTVLQKIELPNFQKTVTNNNIIKLVNEDVLIYLKPPVGAFGGTHDPRYCWQGSGYEFKHIHPVTIENTKIYWATLVRDDDEIVTAWWYENATQRTISEWTWRWQSLGDNSSFRLVNISARDEAILEKEVKRFLKKDALRIGN